jgi:hypothetical protein
MLIHTKPFLKHPKYSKVSKRDNEFFCVFINYSLVSVFISAYAIISP